MEAVQIIGAIGAILVAFWAMFRYFFKTFIEYLEKKDEDMKNVSLGFNQTVQKFIGTIQDVRDQIERANDHNDNALEVLERASKALQDHHNHL